MGASWRIGVDPSEKTELVTTGLFAWVRNPIFSAVLTVLFGLMLAVPNVLAAAAFFVALVPEPTTGLLVMVGVLGLAVSRRTASVSA